MIAGRCRTTDGKIDNDPVDARCADVERRDRPGRWNVDDADGAVGGLYERALIEAGHARESRTGLVSNDVRAIGRPGRLRGVEVAGRTRATGQPDGDRDDQR